MHLAFMLARLLIMSRFFDVYRNRSGISLPSLMVGVAIVGILATGVLSVIENMSKSQNTIELRSQVDVFEQEIRAHLSQPAACTRTLQSATLNAAGAVTSVAAVLEANGAAKYSVGQRYGGGIFRVLNMSFRYSPGDDPSRPGVGEGVFSFQVESTKPVTGPSILRPREIVLRTSKVLASDVLIDCISMSKMTDGIWVRSATSSGAIADVHFPGGNVGVNVTNPAAKLEVAGQIVSKENVVDSGAQVNFHNGNSQILRSVGSNVIQLTNMQEGGVYNVIVEDSTSRTYTFAGCATTYWSPANGPTTNRSIFSIYRSRSNICYVSWSTDFN